MTTTIHTIRHRIRKRYKSLNSWGKTGREFSIDKAMAWRIAKEPGYEPHDPHIRMILDLPIFKPAPVCATCGEVHITKRCTTRPRRYRDLYSIPTPQLRQMIENREEFK